MQAVRLALPVLPGAQCRRGAQLAFLHPLLTAADGSRGAEVPALLLFGAGRTAASLCQHTAASSIPSCTHHLAPLVAEGKGAVPAQSHVCPLRLSGCAGAGQGPGTAPISPQHPERQQGGRQGGTRPYVLLVGTGRGCRQHRLIS